MLSRDSSMRRQSSLTVVESAKVLECALQSRAARVDDVFVTDDSMSHPLITRLSATNSVASTRIWRVQRADALRTDTTTTPSVAAIVHFNPEFTQETHFRAHLSGAKGARTVAVLHNLQNPTNVGALLRSAAAFDAAVVVTGLHSADLLNPKCTRASAGAIFALPALWVEPDVERVVRVLKGANFDIVNTCASSSTRAGARPDSLASVCARDRVAFLLGNEGNGVDPSTEQLATHRVHIETSNRVESLNVGVAGALLLFQRSLGRLRQE
jgi:TrmH family RNA methyltransferase